MHPRAATALAALLVWTVPTAAKNAEAEPEDVQTTLNAAITPGGDEVRLVTMIGGKAKTTLQIGKDKPSELAVGDAVGAIEVAHGKVVVALATTDDKQPFRIHVGDKVTKIARPGKRYDLPFAMAMAATPTGFTVFFQEIEAQNVNEAHTYMQKLDKTGALDGDLREVAVPWWIGDAAWNGQGYHLALYYAGDMNGMRLSMVTLSAEGAPQQHPDWASQPGQLSDMHLVADGKRVLAYYRGGVGDRVAVTDVTKIGQWAGKPQAAKDLGALDATSAIAFDTKGRLVRVKAATAAKAAKDKPKPKQTKKQKK